MAYLSVLMYTVIPCGLVVLIIDFNDHINEKGKGCHTCYAEFCGVCWTNQSNIVPDSMFLFSWYVKFSDFELSCNTKYPRAMFFHEKRNVLSLSASILSN